MPADSSGSRRDSPGGDGPAGTHERRRVRRLRLARVRPERYYLLLVLLLIDVCLIGLAGSSRWATFAYTPVTAATLLLALYTSQARRRTLRVAWIAAIIAVAASAGVALSGSARLTGYVYFLLFALLLISPLAILRRIVSSRRVTLRLLVAAICVYLMIGLLFTFVYLGINGVHPNFFAQGAEKDPAIYLYFSFITMTTVGYGDFTPGWDVPRVLVVFEAMLGQVFLVTAVARLVSLYSAQEPQAGRGIADAGDDG